MTIYAPMVRICNECGAEEWYDSVMSTNNFGGDFAEPIGIGATDQPCRCGSTNFEREDAPFFEEYLMLSPINCLPLSDSVTRRLIEVSITHVVNLVQHSDESLKGHFGLSEEELTEISEALSVHGLSLGFRLPPDWISFANRN